MGEDTIRIGGSFTDESTASMAPFDAQYLYLAGGIVDDDSCKTSCTAPCGDWWGCWQDWSVAPGQYVLSHIDRAASATWEGSPRPQIPVITYYEQLQSSSLGEGTEQVNALNVTADLTLYLDDWRFLLQTIGNREVWLHIEPDLWGYVRAVNPDPHAVPAQVAAANPTDCATYENSAAGVSQCMISMTRKYAPNAKVGLHASAWLIMVDGDAEDVGQFMLELGAGESDFIVTDPADRDAGYYEVVQGTDRWWDDAGAREFLDWNRRVAEAACKPIVMWQIPLGNMDQDNTPNHYQDNRLDWLFANISDVAASHCVALLFGAGEGTQTTPETDGGNFIDQTIAYRASGGEPLCP
ncbi:MAG: hypothetical protein JXR45_17305 [Deltaproteobacteria bacterium]|nr:hypothetical protein [Deltaproteobacteria bacterium]